MPPKRSKAAIQAILALSAFAAIFATTSYLPSLPSIADDLQASENLVQSTLTSHLFGFAMGYIVLGPLSDLFGRKAILVSGLALLFVSSFVCALTGDIYVVIVGRLFQGFGACTGLLIGVAIIRDLNDQAGTAKGLSILVMATAAAPAISLVFGGLLDTTIGWRAGFAIIGGMAGTVAVLVAWLLPETYRKRPKRSSSAVGAFLFGYGILLSNARFMTYALVGSMGLFIGYAFFATAPFVTINVLGLSPEVYGILGALPPAANFLGALTINRISGRFSVSTLVITGALIQATGVALLFFSTRGALETSFQLFGPMVLFGFGNGVALSVTYAAASRYHKHVAGAAGGIIGFMSMGGATVGTTLAGSFDDGDMRSVTFLMLGAGIISICASVSARLMPPPTSQSTGTYRCQERD